MKQVFIQLLSPLSFTRFIGIAMLTIGIGSAHADTLPSVTIAATDASAAEAASDPGTFRITRVGDATNALTVNYTIAAGAGQAVAADYTPALTGTVIIPAAQSFIDITITPVDDILLEGDETVTLTLAADATYDLGAPVTATVTITDNETAIDLSRYVRIGRYDLPEPTRTAHPANSLLAQEASNVTYNWDTDTLFMTGDGGTSVVQVSKTGVLIDSMTLPPGGSPQGTEFYDTEGITYVGNNQFVFTEERDRQLNLFTYVGGGILQRSATKTVKLGTTIGNVGLEGVTYDPLSGVFNPVTKTGGFICVKEKTPQSVFQTNVDFTALTATNGSPTSTSSTDLFNPSLAGLSDFSDIFSLSNLPALAGKPTNSHLLIISQESGQIVHIDRAGVVSSTLTIVADAGSPLTVPDMTMEGVTMDRNGVLYVTNENGGGDANHPQLWVYAPSNAPNLAPTALALNNTITSIPENTSTAGGVKLADIVITDDGLGVNTVTLSGTDASFFQVTGTALFLKAGTVLNSTSKPTYNVTVNVDDTSVGSTPDASVNFTLSVTVSTGGTGQLIISEVAPWSSGNGGPATGANSLRVDWFEVTNIGTAAVNLTGWKMDDNSNSFGSAVDLNGIMSIAPGESVIFLETANVLAATINTKIAAFKSLWFGANPPANLQIGYYSGSGVGLSATADAVNLFNAAGAVQARVDFNASPTGPSFPTFDNAAGLNNVVISNLAVVGVNGAFSAANDANEKGSPGTIGAPATPVITITATDANAAEAGADPGTFRITRTGSTLGSLTVNYTIATGSGQATNGTDYTPTLTGVATIPSGQPYVDITITPVNDTQIELNETVTLTLGDTGSYDTGSPSTATVTIADNDAATGFTLNTGSLDISTATGLPAGGTLTGPGVTGSTFNSAGLGSGVKTLNYSFTDASGTRNVSFNITLQSVVFTGVAAGDASTNEAIIWTRAVDSSSPAAATNLTAQISTSPIIGSPLTTPGVTVPLADFTLKLDFTGLTAGTQYYYRFVGPAGELSLVGTFKTAPSPTTAAPLHFAFSGDNDGLMRPYALASIFPSLNLDFYINLGDVIYENASNVTGNNAASWLNSPSVTLSSSPLNLNGLPAATNPASPFAWATQAQLKAEYEKKYRENFLPVNTNGQNSLQVLYAAQGNYTTWDNHEMGNRKYIDGGAPAGGSVGGATGTDMASGRGVDARNNGAGNLSNINDVNTSATDFMNRAPGFVTLENVFLSYMAIADRGLVNAPADPRSHGTPLIYSAQQWGKNAIYINTDSRTYRDIRIKTANAGADDTTAPRANNPARTMLGATQFAWLKQTLLDAQTAGTPWKFVSLSDAIDQIGPIGGGLTTVTAAAMQPFSGNGAYGPVNADGGKTHQGGYRAERNALLKFIADNHITNVVFLSCDDHQNRINEMSYSPTGQTEVQSSYVKVPYCFSIVCGPLGATGPDLFLNHGYTSIQGAANLIANAQSSAGVDPIGLASSYPGLHNVMRDKGAGLVLETTIEPADFYSPDTFNATVFDVSANGKTLTISSVGMNSTAQNAAAEYNGTTNPARTVFSFQVDSAIDALASVPTGVTVTRGGFVLDRRTGNFLQLVTLTNTGATPVSGTVAIALDSLSANATLTSAAGATASPLALVNVGADNILSPGESATVTLQFNNPTRAAITYTPRVLGGVTP